MLRALIITLLSYLVVSTAQAQSYSLHLQAGTSHFVGDVGDYSPWVPTNGQAGIFFRYGWNDHWGIRLNGHFGRVSAADSLSDFTFRQARNLSFRSNIYEVSAMVEFNFFAFDGRYKSKKSTPYIFAGLGIMGFNPQARVGDEWFDLRPLGTEGQGTPANPNGPYARVSVVIPFGMGYRWAIGKKTALGVEVGFRKTFTDYLDDVSGRYADPLVIANYNGLLAAGLSNRSEVAGDRTGMFRGDPERKDWYIFTGLNLEFYLRSSREKCPPVR
jgi:hypothetical protein